MNLKNKLPFKKSSYSIQVVVILAVFCFVLFNLVFRLILDMRQEAEKKRLARIEAQRVKQEFVTGIETEYKRVLKFYHAGEYEKAIEIIKVFNKYGESEYKELPEIKKTIRMFYLKQKLEFIPKIQLDEYMQLSKDIDIDDDDSTEVFIRTPRYGQYFYTSDFPVELEGAALSIKGDFSGGIVWKSSIDGELGKGKKLFVSLSVGEHEITAVGSNGITEGSMTTKIYIENDPEFLKKYKKLNN
jgi:hypothetical protein